MTPLGSCPLCGTHGPLEGHHPTGRFRGTPIHRPLVFRICGPCNRAQNLLWEQASIADECPGAEVLLRRLTVWLVFWGDRPITSSQQRALRVALADIADRIVTAA
jgi:hypothetical protein